MRYEEKIAATLLRTLFKREATYEPLGKSTPPDFSIDGTAFEVRRLNENFTYPDGKTEGIEETSFQLNRAVYGELAKIPFSPSVGSFFIGLSYARPLRATPSRIAKKLAEEARSYYKQGSRKRQILTASGVTAQIIPASTLNGKSFRPGFETDDRSGGLVGEIYLDNIRLALEEKVRKTEPFVDEFNRWVLILVDLISPGIDWASEMAAWTPDLQHFASIVVLNPNGTVAWLWPPNSLAGMLVRAGSP